MPKVAATVVTVMFDATVAPTVFAVTVTAPAVVPATVTTYCPYISVEPDGVIVAVPAPDAITVMAVLATVLPPASLAVKVRVTGSVPSLGTVLPLAATVTVEPTICTGSSVLAVPAVAVMVAVRLALLAAPEEKVKVA